MVPAYPTRINFVVAEKVEDREVVVFHQ